MIPLSYGQQRLWLLDRFQGTGWVYNTALHLDLRGPLDVPALRAALTDLLERHEVLRTVYPDLDGRPHQLVVPAAGADFLEVGEPVGTDSGLAAALERAVRREFDLARDVPLRALLLPLGADRHTLLLVMHHIAVDGWSVGPLLRDLARAYSARRVGRPPAGGPLPVQFADFAQWQRDLLGSAGDPESLMAEQTAWWRSALTGMPEEMELPAVRPR